MINNGLIIQANSKDVFIKHNEDKVIIEFKNDLDIIVEMGGDVALHSKGDFFIAAEGELGFISIGKPLCLDSIDSRIHMNYRMSSPIKDLPESIEYRKKLDEGNQKHIEFNTIQEKSLKERIKLLEDKVNKLIGIFDSNG